MRVKLHPEARLDLKAAKAFYRDRSPLAAAAFASEVATAISRIAEAPLRYPAGEHGTRRLVLPWRFPYTVVYLVRAKAIEIVAVAHEARDPRYWERRL